MKKVVMAVLAAGLAVGGGFRQAYGQDRKVEFSVSLGVMFNKTSHKQSFELLTLSPRLDIHVTRRFMISPEAMVALGVDSFAYPGVILNYSGEGFFAGAGAVAPLPISADDRHAEPIYPKFNFGYRNEHVHLTAFYITGFKDLFDENLFGAMIGYRF